VTPWLRDRVREGRVITEPAWPDTGGQGPIALARRDSDSRTVSLILDATPANIASAYTAPWPAPALRPPESQLGRHSDLEAVP
jgi:hypothetical protein